MEHGKPSTVLSTTAEISATQTNEQITKGRELFFKDRSWLVFSKGVKNAATWKKYSDCVRQYMSKQGATAPDQLLIDRFDLRAAYALQQKIEAHILDIQTKRKAATAAGASAALQKFFVQNDITGMNWKKINSLVGDEDNDDEIEDTVARAYTLQELNKILQIASDPRKRALVYVLISTGVRIGAISKIKLKHMLKLTVNIPMPSAGGSTTGEIYAMVIYAGKKSINDWLTEQKWPKHIHIVFTTPEAARHIDDYLAFRKAHGDILDADENLFSQEFNTRVAGAAAKPKPLAVGGCVQLVNRIVTNAGLHNDASCKSDGETAGQVRYNVQTCHGFRKFAITQMATAHMDKEYRDIITDHHNTLDAVYVHPPIEELAAEYAKAIPYLTIDQTAALKAVIFKQQEKVVALQKAVADSNKEADRLHEIMSQYGAATPTPETT